MSYFLHRLAGRILRRVMGLQREPVRKLTEADYRLIDMGYGILIGLASMGTVAVILLLLLGRPVCP